MAITSASSFAGNLHQRMRKCGQRREIILRHAHELVGLAVAGDLHPMIFEQLEFNFFIGQQPHEFEKFFCRDGAGAFFFHFGFAGRADAQLKIGRGDVEAIAFGLAEEIRENRDRRLALDDALRESEFVEQIEFLYAEFHRVGVPWFLVLGLL